MKPPTLIPRTGPHQDAKDASAPTEQYGGIQFQEPIYQPYAQNIEYYNASLLVQRGVIIFLCLLKLVTKKTLRRSINIQRA